MSEQAAPRILVAIPTLNEALHIETCLRSLQAGGETVDFVVVDGGSRDDTCAIVRRLQSEFGNLELLHNPQKIQSAAVNLAAKQGAGSYDLLIRCDAHAEYPKGFIADLAAALARTGADSVVTPMDAVGSGCFQRAVAWIVDTPLGSGGAPHRGGRRSGFVDHGHHAAFKLSRFLELGGYDESFTHNEDAEYDRRLAAAGGRIWLDADIRLRYVPRGSVASLWRQYRKYGEGRARTVLKHRLRPAPRQLVPVANLVLIVAALAIAPLFFWALAWPALYAGILVAASIGMALKHRSACGLFSGVALAIMHNAWALGFLGGVAHGALMPRAAAAAHA